MNLKNVMPEERNQTSVAAYCMIHVYETSKVSTSIKTNNKLSSAAGGWEEETELTNTVREGSLSGR